MNYAIIFTIVFTIFILGSLGFSQDAHAVTRTFSTNTAITTDQTIAVGESWTIKQGVILLISPDVTITNAGKIFNSGIMVNSGSITNSGFIKHNLTSSTYFGTGTLTGPGKIALNGAASTTKNIASFGPSNIKIFHVLPNHTLTVAAGKTLTIPTGYVLNNFGTIDNAGIITNAGIIKHNLASSTYSGNGTITGVGKIALYGISTTKNIASFGPSNIKVFHVLPNHTLTVAAGKTLTIPTGYVLNNSGIIVNSGSITNSSIIKHNLASSSYSGTGTITGPGKIGLYGTPSTSKNISSFGPSNLKVFHILPKHILTVPAGKTLIVPAGYVLNNYGTLVNSGSITNSSIIKHNLASSSYSGTGTITGPGKIGLYGTTSTLKNISSFGPSNLKVFHILPKHTLTVPTGKTLTIPTDYVLNNFGTLANTGTITNAGIIKHNLASSTYSGNGAVTGTGKIALYGATATKNISSFSPSNIKVFHVLPNHTLTVAAGKTLTVPAGYIMKNSGTIANFGIVSNYGTLENRCGYTYTGAASTPNIPVGICS